MTQPNESVAWKHHAAGTLAKRNQMLSLQRIGTGLPPKVQPTAIFDASVYSVRPGVSSFRNTVSEDLNFETAKIVSPALSEPPNLPARFKPETLQMAFSESHASRPGYPDAAAYTGAAYPSPLQALPPQRVPPSRIQKSVIKHEVPDHKPSLSSLLRMSSPPSPVAPSSLLDPFQNATPPNIEEHEYALSSHNTHTGSASTVDSGQRLPPRVPLKNPFIPSELVKVKTPKVELVLEDSGESENDADKTSNSNPELTAEEKLDLEVLQEQFGHLLEAVKSKKLTGAVKISHGMNALRLAVHLNSNRAHLETALTQLQTALYKLAWDYCLLFFETEPFDALVQVSADGRCLQCSKIALQVLLVLFERDARVNGGAVREELFDNLREVIGACLSSDDDEFKLGWGLWFVSYFASRRDLASSLLEIFPLEPMLLMLMADCEVSTKYKIMQSLRNMTASCSELHSVLANHHVFAPWLIRACANQKLNPTAEDRMLHVQTLGVIWNMCSSPDSAAKLLVHGVCDALAIVLEMPFSDTQEIALLAFADIASTEHCRLRLLDSRLAVSLCGLAKSIPPPTTGVYEGCMRVFFALSETEQIKKKKFDSEQSSHGDKKRSNGLNLDEHFFRSMGIIDVIGHLLRNGGEMTKLLALGTLINLCQNPKNVPLIRQFVAPYVEQIANSMVAPSPLRDRAQALTLVLNDRSRNSCVVM